MDESVQNIIHHRRLEGLEDFQPGDLIQVNLWHSYCWSYGGLEREQPSFFQVNLRRNFPSYLATDVDAHQILGIEIKATWLFLGNSYRITICSHPKNWTLIRANRDNQILVKANDDVREFLKGGRIWEDRYLEAKIFFQDLEREQLRLEFIDHYARKCRACQDWNTSSTTGNLQLPSCEEGKGLYRGFYNYLNGWK